MVAYKSVAYKKIRVLVILIGLLFRFSSRFVLVIIRKIFEGSLCDEGHSKSILDAKILIGCH